MTGKRVPPEELARLRAMYEDEGLSVYEIADREKLSSSAVQRRLYRASTKMRSLKEVAAIRTSRNDRSEQSLETVAEWRQLYESGRSTYDIASLYGVEGQTVRRWLRDDGVTMREGGKGKRGRRAPTPGALARVARRSWSGASVSEIAEEVKESEAIISYWLCLVDAVTQALESSHRTEKGD